MAFLFSKSAPVIQMHNPLHFDHTEMVQQTEMGSLKAGQVPLDGTFREESNAEDFCHVPAFNTFGKEDPVHCWSVDDVVSWVQENVPIQSERLEDCCQAFVKEGIDGLRFLALQRNNHACSGMTDSEWLLLYGARESLLSRNGNRFMLSAESIPSSPSISSPTTPKGVNQEDSFLSSHVPLRLHTSKSLSLRPSHKSGFLRSSLRFLSLSSRQNWWSSSASTKYEQKDPVATELYALQEEILSAEEREAILKAKMQHLDEILRTAQLASYFYTRMRWTPLPGELPVDDSDVDDWLQRFLVLEGSTLFFFPQAADLRPEGAILFTEVVEVGLISGKIQHDEEDITWFGFHVTTSEGLRLECATPIKLQADLWMSMIQASHSEQHSLLEGEGTS